MTRSLLCLFALTSTVFAKEHPNVLMICVDDLKPLLGCYGDEQAITPNIDKLAARGMRFDAAYCNQAVCAPSRNTLMLGSRSTTLGIYDLGTNFRRAVPNGVTIPQYFRKFGYRTEAVGKILHSGHGNTDEDPASWSVPIAHEPVVEYHDPASTEGGKLTREEAYFDNLHLGDIHSLPKGTAWEMIETEDETYADGRIAAEGIKRLKAAKERTDTPFFLALGFVKPHLPFTAPKKYWDLYDPEKFQLAKINTMPEGAPGYAGKRGGELANFKPIAPSGSPDDETARQLIHGYYAAASYTDAQIGKVMNELDELGLADDTIIILWGDHGWHLGDLGIWTKHTNYEQANRIPFLVIAPGVAKPGSSTEELAETVDIYPTLVSLAGLPAPEVPQPLDGIDLTPALKDPAERLRDHVYSCFPRGERMGRNIRTDRYRMVEWKIPGAPDDTADYELYDYKSGSIETVNLADKKPSVLKELKAMLDRHPEALTHPRAEPRVAKSEISLSCGVEITEQDATGVLIAQGGNRQGYVLHLENGVPAFDVRIDGKLTKLRAAEPFSGKIALSASLTQKSMSISVDGKTIATIDSPGLLTRQPTDHLSTGEDDQSPVGDYKAPHAFSGKLTDPEVTATPVK